MTRQEFKSYIERADFTSLFISEMGWNNPQGNKNLPPYIVDDITFMVEKVAERSGFQILHCVANEIPGVAVCKKLDTKIRRNAEDYICIFHIPNTIHHLWIIPLKKVEKRDLVKVEYENVEQTEFLYGKIDELTFDLGTSSLITEVKERVKSAFLVNSEQITRSFYTGFRQEHNRFAAFITGINDEVAVRNNRDKQWYTSVMLNRLMFCYFIQKKGFLDNNKNYLGDKLNWVREKNGEDQFYGTFYKRFLRILFHDGLNSPQKEIGFTEKFGRIPYLNGGMFDEHQLEQQYPDIDISDAAFESLFAFFDNWHWHLDDRITATGRDINPDVLGYIFEQYINDRAAMGAYYTKEDITEYIGRNTIVPFLLDAVKKKEEKVFKDNGDFWNFLKESGDKYIYDAVKKGGDKQAEIPQEIAEGIDTTSANLIERRKHWNERTPENWGLPTEIWRETIERLQRYNDIKTKIANGEINSINDFITYNLDIRQFVCDFLSTTKSHKFVGHFYNELRKVTILDPTCGSGAFLFAALNILEPLYEICLSRMQEFHDNNENLFKEELKEVSQKYRSNIQYFIYKSIILRNLYGVDIMVEATEIAKLRLFLKLVAVVDVDLRDENMGLDPLPDVDFNIRAGNTLVGYATEKELVRDIISDAMASHERDKIEDEMQKVSQAYEAFKTIQLDQDEEAVNYKDAKKELKERLAKLRFSLDRIMYRTVADGEIQEENLQNDEDYKTWYSAHLPIHWLGEFYDIIHGNGGFDVIIGNPPYVKYTEDNCSYKLINYKTINSGNLYAFCMERSLQLLKTKRMGMIVPLSSICAKKMASLRDLMSKFNCWVSSYEIRPSKLFDGADQRVTIFITATGVNPQIYSTSTLRWESTVRYLLFITLHYTETINNERIWRLCNPIEESIYHKFSAHKESGLYVVKKSDYKIHYRSAGLRYWIIFLNNGFGTESLSNKSKCIIDINHAKFYMAAYNSNIFWWYYSVNFDMFNLSESNIFNFRLNYEDDNNIETLSERLEEDLNNNRTELITNKSNGEINISYAYKKKLSKSIIDEIDKALAKHYGFTEEELDFIINYDIKYRMGDELNE